MVQYNPGCMGNYDFEHIACCAKKRFIDGFETVTLLEQAKTDQQREEIALVCLLDVEDDIIRNIKLSCRYSRECEMTNCRDLLRQLIEQQLKGGAEAC